MRKFNSELTHVGTININLPKIFRVIYNSGRCARGPARARGRGTTDGGAAGERVVHTEFIKFIAHSRLHLYVCVRVFVGDENVAGLSASSRNTSVSSRSEKEAAA